MSDRAIPESPYPITYIGETLDRAAHLRADTVTLAAMQAEPSARFAPVWKYSHPFAEGLNPRYLSGQDAHDLIAAGIPAYFLGLINEQPQWALDFGSLDESELPDHLAGCDWLDLRKMGSQLDAETANLLVLARALSYWHWTQKFCGRCGTATKSHRGGFERTCQNPDCGHIHYPRADPVVIMLVTDEREGHEPRALLGRSMRLPEGVYSTLAGYVEPGESLEQAVAREVLEESGIIATDCEYRASQPWPFPSSLMLGYRARAVSFDITIDDTEMLDVKWFTREELKQFGEWGDEEAKLKLPRPDSIARALIEDWVNEIS